MGPRLATVEGKGRVPVLLSALGVRCIPRKRLPLRGTPVERDAQRKFANDVGDLIPEFQQLDPL